MAGPVDEGGGDDVGIRHASYSTSVLAACAVSADADRPLRALRVAEIDPPEVPAGWVTVDVKAASLNQHDVWSLRGVGLAADRLPMILGCDAAGVTDDGRAVIVYGVVNDPDFIGSDARTTPSARCCRSATRGPSPPRSGFRRAI